MAKSDDLQAQIEDLQKRLKDAEERATKAEETLAAMTAGTVSVAPAEPEERKFVTFSTAALPNGIAVLDGDRHVPVGPGRAVALLASTVVRLIADFRDDVKVLSPEEADALNKTAAEVESKAAAAQAEKAAAARKANFIGRAGA